MSRGSTFWRHALAAGLAMFWMNSTSHADQTYPTRTIQMIVPFAAGGSTDVLGRIVAKRLSEILGQPIVIDNRGGADGRIGMSELAKAAPDGYTILFCTTSTHAINPALYAGKLPYDPGKAFKNVILAATAPNILVVNKDLPVASVKELVALSKSRANGLNGASGATMLLLNQKLMESQAGGNYIAVPYKGTAPALNDLVGGQVDFMFDQITTSLPFVKAGRLRALAVTSDKRFTGLPDVPTMIESGMPNFVTTSWWGVLAPGQTPEPIVRKLNEALNQALQDSNVRAQIASIGGTPMGGTPEQFDELVNTDRKVWAKVIKDYNISPE
jgi:tripartite-type tricarboxylate transporter receptor subunit TctC